MLNVIKVGGHVLDNPALLEKLLQALAENTKPCLLVHGGGKKATELSQKLGIPTQLVQGRRCTDAATLEVVTMVYAGLINKQLVAQLQAKGRLSLGLSGADLGIIPSKKRSPVPLDFGFVGDPITEDIQHEFIEDLLKSGILPIVAPITSDSQGQLLNTNADTIAASLAIAMSRSQNVSLYYCFEKAGVLVDPDLDHSKIDQITKEEAFTLLETGVIQGGMIPKIQTALKALEQGVREVCITNVDGICRELKGYQDHGTRILGFNGNNAGTESDRTAQLHP